MKTTATKNILFDLGGVLLHLRYEKAIAAILPTCPPDRIEANRSFFTLFERDDRVNDYESGRMTASDFYDYFCGKTGCTMAFDEFVQLWRSIFERNSPMIQFARRLKQTYNLYLWSNAGDLHIPYVFEAFPELNFFDGNAVSCYIGAMKPDVEYYERAIKKLSIRPEESLFIDDRIENIEGARAYGIPSILYDCPEQTIQKIEQYLKSE